MALRKILLALLVLAPVAPAVAAPTILVVGDSLSAAYGIPTDEGWVALLQERLRAEGYPHRVVNHSRHGRVSAELYRELPASLLEVQPDLVIVEIGAVDAFKGVPLADIRQNLTEIVRLAGSEAASVALLEMQLPRAMGDPDFADRFRRGYASVARAQGVTLVPFFMASFMARPAAFQPDRIHPGAAVQVDMMNAVWPTVAQLLPRGPSTWARRPGAPSAHATAGP